MRKERICVNGALIKGVVYRWRGLGRRAETRAKRVWIVVVVDLFGGEEEEKWRPWGGRVVVIDGGGRQNALRGKGFGMGMGNILSAPAVAFLVPLGIIGILV